MAFLLGLIFLGSIPVFVVGLINPRWVLPPNVSHPTRKLSSLVWGGTFFASILLIWLTVPKVESPSAVTSQPVETEPTPAAPPSIPPVEPSVTPSTQPVQTIDSSVSYARNGAGLGDSIDKIGRAYGSNIGNEVAARYQNDYLHVLYEDGIAHHLAVQFPGSQKERRTRSEALAAVVGFMPQDAVKIKEWQEDSEQYVIQYESESFASAYSAEMQEWLWMDASTKPGTILVIMTHDSFQPDSIFSAIVAFGDPGNI